MPLFGGAGQTGEGREGQTGVEENTWVGGLGGVLLILGCGGGVVVGTATRGLLRAAAELDNTAVHRTLALPCDLANIVTGGQAGGGKHRRCSTHGLGRIRDKRSQGRVETQVRTINSLGFGQNKKKTIRHTNRTNTK